VSALLAAQQPVLLAGSTGVTLSGF